MPKRAEVQAHFAAFTAEHLDTLVRIARSLTGDPDSADDLTQHSLEKAYRSWSVVMNTEQPLAYVRRILVNTYRDSWRRRRRFTELFGSRAAMGETADLTAWGNPERRVDATMRLDALMRPLTARERAVVTLRYLADLSEADTAAELGVAIGTVKSTTARAFGKMRAVESQMIGA